MSPEGTLPRKGGSIAAGSGSPIARRLAEHWADRGWTRPGDRVVVACSGGLDSLVLLHLLRFSLRELDLELEAAYFDHRMRPGSATDAEWLRGLCGAWGIEFHLGRAPRAPESEEGARELRYDFLQALLGSEFRRWVVTAHHADDQVETILFQVLRGTGVAGLQGMPESRAPGILRPLLPFPRSELERYARAHRLRPRLDPTNQSSRFARNRVRGQLLPLLEEVHPGARAGILRLARNSRRVARALELLLASRLEEIVVDRRPERIVVDRARLLAQEESVQIECLRSLCRGLGVVLTESGTASAMEFISEGRSGAGIALAGRLRLSREFERILLVRAPKGEPGADHGSRGLVLALPSPESGEGTLELGGRRWRVRWGDTAATSGSWRWVAFDPQRLSFPLRMRGWRPGDRTRTAGGGKKLKKLFGERRIPRSSRGNLPVLVDREGWVLWVPGVHRAPGVERWSGTEGRTGRWFVGVTGANEL